MGGVWCDGGVSVLTTHRKGQMLVYAVLWQGMLIGLYTCATDAAVASKPLDNSTVVTCHLNAETTNGAVLLTKATPTPSRQ